MWSKIFKIHTGGNFGNTCDTEELRAYLSYRSEKRRSRAQHAGRNHAHIAACVWPARQNMSGITYLMRARRDVARCGSLCCAGTELSSRDRENLEQKKESRKRSHRMGEQSAQFEFAPSSDPTHTGPPRGAARERMLAASCRKKCGDRRGGMTRFTGYARAEYSEARSRPSGVRGSS